MRNLLHRLRHGSEAWDLTDALSHEARDSGGSDWPGSDPPAGDSTRGSAPLTNAEVSVLISIDNTLARRDRRIATSLARRQKALVAAAHASVGAATRLEAARANPRWVNGGLTADDEPGMTSDREPDPAPHPGRRQFREMFDPHQPLITERVLLIIEAVFVLVELAFWYGVFSGNLDRNAPLLDPVRVSDVLLAIMIPLSGIVAARVVGGLTHRAICRYPGVGRKEYIGAAVSAVVAFLAIFAIYSLVNARFDASSQLGATPLPAVAMTLVFVVVLLGDMMARIFLVSEIRAQTDKWLRQLRKLKTAAMRANQRHCASWLDLRNAVQTQLDHCERIVAAGSRIISDHRARRRTPAPQVPAGSGAAIRSAHAQPTDPVTASGSAAAGPPMAVPSVTPLQLYDVSLVLGPLRVIEDAINTLGQWPPRGQRELTDYLADVLTRLYRLRDVATVAERGLRPTDAGGRIRPPAQTPIEPRGWYVDEVNGTDAADDQERGKRGDLP